ncbi:MAG TPA: two-component regulator propeller domain-containing protein [Thermoanaerobaculia bacterium]|nr:two-component regulator propeller domain-containing protein [Thermoanaerobaculia bacterium]
MTRPRLLAALLFVVTATVATAADKPFRLDPTKAMTQYVTAAWRDTSGLPVDSISAIAQTPDGYLWIGTEHGLARFDGVRFTIFTRANTPALQTNEILSLFVSRDGTLWIGTNGAGALTYDGTRFSRVPIRLKFIMDFAQSGDGAVWIGAPGGIVRVHGGKYALFSKQEGYPTGKLAALAADANGVYAALPPGIVRIDERGSRTWSTQEGLSSVNVTSLRWTSRGLLAGNEDGTVARLEGDRFVEIYRAPHSHPIASILEGANDSLWMGTIGGGILRYANGATAQFTEEDGLTSNSVMLVFEDLEGNLWAGTTGGGVFVMKEGRVTTVVPPRPLTGEWILPLVDAPDGSVWFSTNGGGVNRLDGNSLTRITTANGLYSNSISAIVADRAGVMWIAVDGALHRMDGMRVARTFSSRDGLTGMRTFAVTPARDGSLFVSTSDGLFRVAGETVTRLSQRDGISSGVILGVREAADGSLWLLKPHTVEHVVDRHATRFGREDGLLAPRLSSISIDEKDGSVWIATSDGLARIRDGRVHVYHAADGLLTDSLYGVVQDGDGNLWLPTSHGLFTVRRSALDLFDTGRIQHMPITVFRKADGLKSSDFTGGLDRVGFRAADGRLWFPTTRGLVVVDPERLQVRVDPPRVRVEQTLVDTDGQRRVEIAYTAPTFDAPESISFRYKLEGFDEKWNDVGTRRNAYYTNIGPGTYRFIVQATTAEGRTAQAWSQVKIEPRFYEETSFKVSAVMIAALLILLVYRRRTDNLRRHQAELRRSEEHFRSLIENAADMILVVGSDDTIDYGSPSIERTLGFDAVVMHGRNLGDFLQSSEEGAAFLAEVRERGRHAATLPFRDATGARREVESIGAMFGDGKVVVNCRDITDRRRLESQLEQANRLASLGRLAATVSHEFNNVLMGIQPFVDLIRRKATDAGVAHATMQMTRSVNRGKRISEQILRYTRPVEPTLRAVAVRSWLVDLETELRSLVGAEVRMAIVAPGGLTIDADTAQLNQVLTNLAINARDAGATSVRIEAGTVEGDGAFSFGIVRDSERYAHIRFTDNGGGIPDSVLPKIFEPLFTTKTSKGTGLGLAVAQQIVARHGGEMFVESRVGAGTTFHLFLPIAVSEAGELLTGDESLATVDAPQCRILLVEDDALVAEGMIALLEDKGFHVELAMTGSDALNVIPRFAPEVIVLDVGLPDIDGLELYVRIAKRWPELRVIFSTGHGDVAALEESLPPPHPPCLLKPYTVETLIAAIAA